MNAPLLIALAAAIYAIYNWLAYNPAWKTSSHLMWIGLTCAIAANALWITLAKATTSADKLMFYALVWDAAIVMLTVAIPVLFYGARPGGLTLAGLVLALGGLALMKVGAA